MRAVKQLCVVAFDNSFTIMFEKGQLYFDDALAFDVPILQR